MNRWDVINKFIKERGYTSYLEIGYYKGWSFDQVNCKNKIAVDPNPSKFPEQEEIQYGRTILNLKKTGIEKLVKSTSDEFFKKNKDKFDIVFIDGLHESKQVQKDILNSLAILNEGGVILLHDCNPPTEAHTLNGVDGCWNGDVYKAIMTFKFLNPLIYTIDTDWGIGVIEKFDLEDIDIVSELDWEYFETNRKESIGLISLEQFISSSNRVDVIQMEIPEVPHITDSVEKKFTFEVPKSEKDLIFISAQPDDLNFSFQVEIFLENCIKIGYTNEIHILLYVPQDRIGQKNHRFVMLEERYKITNPNIKFFWYEDIANNVLPISRRLQYIPLLRPWTLKKHFETYPDLSDKAIFYHDNDIAFTRKLDFSKFLNDDINYLSLTGTCEADNYLNATYFDSQIRKVLPEKLEAYKKIDVLDTLAKMNGISREICEQNNSKTGGAQHLLKNIDAKYWEDVYHSIITIRNYLWYNSDGINAQYFANENAGFQSWCADMWAVLWNLWKRGFKTETPEEFNFAWATDTIEKLSNVYIYHDAGVVTGVNDNIRFDKNKHAYKFNGGLILPYVEDLSYVSPKTASYFYVKEIENVKKKYNY